MLEEMYLKLKGIDPLQGGPTGPLPQYPRPSTPPSRPNRPSNAFGNRMLEGGGGAPSTDAPYTPKYPLEQKSMNMIGERLMGAMEDPRNAWMGTGPMMGVVKGAKALGGAAREISKADALARLKEAIMKHDPEGWVRMNEALPFDKRTAAELQKDYNYIFKTKQDIIKD